MVKQPGNTCSFVSLKYERRSFCFAGVGLKTQLAKSFTLGPVRLRALLHMALALISTRPWRGAIAMMWVYKIYGRFNRGARVLRRKKTFVFGSAQGIWPMHMPPGPGHAC